MTHPSEVRKTKPAVYDAWKNGDISDEEARKFFGPEWDDVRTFSEAEDFVASQSEPDIDDQELFS